MRAYVSQLATRYLPKPLGEYPLYGCFNKSLIYGTLEFTHVSQITSDLKLKTLTTQSHLGSREIDP